MLVWNKLGKKNRNLSFAGEWVSEKRIARKHRVKWEIEEFSYFSSYNVVLFIFFRPSQHQSRFDTQRELEHRNGVMRSLFDLQ